MIENLVEKHCDQKKLEELNESFGDLEEGLPKPLDLLATLPHLKLREEILLYLMKMRHKKPLRRSSQSLF